MRVVVIDDKTETIVAIMDDGNDYQPRLHDLILLTDTKEEETGWRVSDVEIVTIQLSDGQNRYAVTEMWARCYTQESEEYTNVGSETRE